MARKLKTYQTSLGFFDLAIAAPSMKAALEAWGADSNLFHQGAAGESDDPDVIAATLKRPGVVLKRPVGSDGSFNEQAALPANLSSRTGPTKSARKSKGSKAKKPPTRPIDGAAARKAALAYEREKRPRGRRSANAGSKPLIRRERSWTGLNGNMQREPTLSRPNWRPLRSNLEPKKPAGNRKKSDWKQP